MALSKVQGAQIESPVDISAVNLTGVSTIGDLNATRVNVTGVSTFSANINVLDNNQIRVGTGSDLLLFHNGNDSFVYENGTGSLALVSSLGDVTINTTNESNTSNVERFRVKGSTGYIGIGTTNPLHELQVYGNSGDTIIACGDSSLTNPLIYLVAEHTTGVCQVNTRSNHPLAFNVFNSEKARIDTSGNFGIGTTIPSSYAETKGIAIRGSNRAGLPTYSGQDGTDTTGFINMYANSSDGFNRYFDIGTVGDPSGAGSNIRFITQASAGGNAVERMRIDRDGTIYFGVAGIAPSGSVGGSAFLAESNSRRTLYMASTTTSGTTLQVFRNPNGQIGSITTSGSATAFNTSSDYRLKENVVGLSGAITRVKQLAPKSFNFIADADTIVDGFLAHEAQDVVPEAVTGTHNEVDDEGNPVYQGIDQSKLVPLLTAALQEAIAKIETLESKVADLTARITVLEQ